MHKCFILKLQSGSLYTQSDWLDTGPVMSVDAPPRAYWLPRSLDAPLLSKGLTNPLSPCAGEFRPSTNVGVSLFVSVLMSRPATLSVHVAGRGKTLEKGQDLDLGYFLNVYTYYCYKFQTLWLVVWKDKPCNVMQFWNN